jgi:hypothetical protein
MIHFICAFPWILSGFQQSQTNRRVSYCVPILAVIENRDTKLLLRNVDEFMPTNFEPSLVPRCVGVDWPLKKSGADLKGGEVCVDIYWEVCF